MSQPVLPGSPESPAVQHSASNPRKLSKIWERFYATSPSQQDSSTTTEPVAVHHSAEVGSSAALGASAAGRNDLNASPARDQRSQTADTSPADARAVLGFPTSTLRIDGEPVLARSRSAAGGSGSQSGSVSDNNSVWKLKAPRWTAAQARAPSTSTTAESPKSSRVMAASAVGALAALSGRVASSTKGKEKSTAGGYETLDGVTALQDGEDEEEGDMMSALDGDEGVVVDDEACFVDGGEGTVDFLASLPIEISLYVLLHLEFRDLLAVRAVSRHWSLLSRDNLIWRDLFHRETRWRVCEELAPRVAPLTPALERTPSLHRGSVESSAGKMSRKISGLVSDLGSLNMGRTAAETSTSEGWSTPPGTPAAVARAGSFFGSTPAGSRRQSSSTLSPSGPMPSPSLGSSPLAPLALDWPRLYRDRWLLEQRWAKGQHKSSFLKGHEDSVYCVQFDSAKIVSGSRDKTIRVWNIDTGHCVRTLSGHGGSVLCLTYDEKELFTGSSDCCVFVWDLVGAPGTGKGKWELKRKLIGHTQGVLDLSFDDKQVISCSKDTTIRVWDRETGELLRMLSGHRGPVNAIQLRGNMLASASGDSLLKLWDITTGEVVRVFTGHERGLACVKFSPSGKWLATGSNDKNIKLWNAHTGECVRTFEGHTDLVRSLAFDENRKRLVSGSYDRTARLWDLETGAPLLRFKAHTSLVFDVRFDVSKIITSSHDCKVIVLDFGSGLDVRHFL